MVCNRYFQYFYNFIQGLLALIIINLNRLKETYFEAILNLIKKTNMMENLVRRVLSLEPGIAVNLIISRDGEIMHIKYMLKELEYDHLAFYDKGREDPDDEKQ